MQIVCAPRKAGRSTPMTGTDRSNFCSRTIVGCYVLFFQAEDGIRDLTVTGVQTCALPIFAAEDRGYADRPGMGKRYQLLLPVSGGRCEAGLTGRLPKSSVNLVQHRRARAQLDRKSVV